MTSRACGLVHSSLTTVPVTVSGRFASNSAANEWWAAAGTVDSQQDQDSRDPNHTRRFMRLHSQADIAAPPHDVEHNTLVRDREA